MGCVNDFANHFFELQQKLDQSTAPCVIFFFKFSLTIFSFTSLEMDTSFYVEKSAILGHKIQFFDGLDSTCVLHMYETFQDV